MHLTAQVMEHFTAELFAHFSRRKQTHRCLTQLLQLIEFFSLSYLNDSLPPTLTYFVLLLVLKVTIHAVKYMPLVAI